VTLLELLLAIALLLALGGLVLPALFERLTERAFESSAEIVRSQLLLARAHAQATGEPVEVLFETSPPRVAARRFVPGLVAAQRRSDAPDAAEAPLEALSLDEEQAPESLRIPEPWAERVLADGVWIADRGDDSEGEPAGLGVAAVGAAAGGAVETDEIPRRIRLALFMPDGSAVLAEPVWFRDDHGRRGRLTVNHWTGLPSFVRVRVAEVPQEPQEEEERKEQEQEEEEEPKDLFEQEPGP
jgi:type II secretory pathway pseudopilin PulG